jgi:hypothetical protein
MKKTKEIYHIEKEDKIKLQRYLQRIFWTSFGELDTKDEKEVIKFAKKFNIKIGF